MIFVYYGETQQSVTDPTYKTSQKDSEKVWNFKRKVTKSSKRGQFFKEHGSREESQTIKKGNVFQIKSLPRLFKERMRLFKRWLDEKLFEKIN